MVVARCLPSIIKCSLSQFLTVAHAFGNSEEELGLASPSGMVMRAFLPVFTLRGSLGIVLHAGFGATVHDVALAR